MSIIQKWNSISLVKRIVCGLIIGAILGLLIPHVKVSEFWVPCLLVL